MDEKFVSLDTLKSLTEQGFCYYHFPTQSFAQKWLRETKNMHIAIIRNACGYGVEIDRWLWEHEDVTNYVILDDDSDMLLSQKKHIIKTHALRGISKRDVKRAINILTKTKSI